jgi:hypothetical protein
MLVATWIESIAAHVSRRWGHGTKQASYALLEWEHNSALQLQRLAHQAVGSGTWTRTAQAIPVTESGDTLGILDISDPKHTRLRRREPTHELIDLSSHGHDGTKISAVSATVETGSSDSPRPRYHSGLSYQGIVIDSGLEVPDDPHEERNLMLVPLVI